MRFPATPRLVEPEIMDDPGLDAAAHQRALRALTRINAISGTTGQVGRRILALFGSQTPLHICDIGCGGGDLTIGLAALASRRNLPWQLTGCDKSPTALRWAEARANQTQLAVQWLEQDVLANPLPSGFDVMVSSLFLHHFANDQALQLLTRMRDATHALVISDLRRTRLAWLLTHMAVRLVSRSPVVHGDGPQSVLAGWTQREMSDLAHEAGLDHAVIERCWPWRLLLSWRQKGMP